MSEKVNENAAVRSSYVGEIYTKGEEIVKKEILSNLPKEWRELHQKGFIHIHDLEGYGLTYNCLTFNILKKFPYEELKLFSQSRKIIGIFDYLKDTISKIGNEQSGGMSFANFDNDIAIILEKLEIESNDVNLDTIRSSISSFIYWCNFTRERMGQISYYVTLNIGLANSDLARFICETLIYEFSIAPYDVYKPNIVFKVKAGVNWHVEDKNFFLLEKSLLCTAKKMIPTYMLADSKPNKYINAEEIAIMGCRTRVIQNQYGEDTSIGRGNIDYITINLPKIAFEVSANKDFITDKLIENFKKQWLITAKITATILIDRYQKLIQRSPNEFRTNFKRDLWQTPFSTASNLEEILKHGTLSIGFIGLSETIEIMTGKKYYLDNNAYDIAFDIVQFMRDTIDNFRSKFNMNFTLIGTSGEYISGRFTTLDSKVYKHQVLEKKYYTNSFHVDVDSELPSIEKITKEGPFHALCNGGCITYLELPSSPLGNAEGLKEIIAHAVDMGVTYMGFNFPLDVCNDCKEQGIFDVCDQCGSNHIIRIRRVSGYLEILDYFTQGKKSEVKNRKVN